MKSQRDDIVSAVNSMWCPSFGPQQMWGGGKTEPQDCGICSICELKRKVGELNNENKANKT